MTREELRRQIMVQCDSAIYHTHLVGVDGVKNAKALRELIQTSDATVDQLLQIREAQSQATPDE